MQICRVCDTEIAAAEANDYHVHAGCMEQYMAEFLAELRHLRRVRLLPRLE